MSIIALIPYPDLPGVRIKGKRFDIFGCLTLFFCIVTFNLVFTFFSYESYVLGSIFLIISVLLFIGFCFIEKNVKDPIFPPKLMSNPLSDLFIINFIGFY